MVYISQIIKIFLSTSSFLGIIMFLIIGRQIDIPGVKAFNLDFLKDTILGFEKNIFLLKYFLLILIILFISVCSLGITKFIKDDRSIKIIKIKPIEGSFLPTYISLFLVSLSFAEKQITVETIIILCILYIFWLSLETMSYFNPFWILLGFRFYEIEDEKGNIFTLIIKKKNMKQIESGYHIENLKVINEFTFLHK